MVVYICGRIFYYLAKFDPIEEGSLNSESMSKTWGLIQAVWKAE